MYIDVTAANEGKVQAPLLSGSSGTSRGNHAIFHNTINHDARERAENEDVAPARGAPVIIYASRHEQDERGSRSAITFLNPCPSP